MSDVRRTLVVNFNSPELNALAAALSGDGSLAAFVRPYACKDRWWERGLAALPGARGPWSRTFGRRRLADARLAALTHEAGVAADMCAAFVGRLPGVSAERRQRWTGRLFMALREAVAEAACRHVPHADCVVAYEGFALPAFERAARLGVRAVLDYPVAHHRERRRVRLEENERMPAFAATWPGFDDWKPGHEARLDAEIERADVVLVGSTYAADSFVREGIDRARMRVVPYGVDLRTFSCDADAAPRRAGRFEVVYAGQLTQRKGLAYTLRGYRRFARADSGLTLVGAVVGSDLPLRPYADLFTHVPHQTRSALAATFRASDVFVFPTLVEGMPLVVLEAMACGLPVIVTANGPADLVRDGVEGYVIPERDDEAVTDRLDRLYRQPELRAEMGRRAALRAREFGWDAYARRVSDVLRSLGVEAPAPARRLAPA
jgi:glycosyltransferase involved in cell wall biosynthesis